MSKKVLRAGAAESLLAAPACAGVTVGEGWPVNFADAAVNPGCSDLSITG